MFLFCFFQFLCALRFLLDGTHMCVCVYRFCFLLIDFTSMATIGGAAGAKSIYEQRPVKRRRKGVLKGRHDNAHVER